MATFDLESPPVRVAPGLKPEANQYPSACLWHVGEVKIEWVMGLVLQPAHPPGNPFLHS
jgi:hypothetical protein